MHFFLCFRFMVSGVHKPGPLASTIHVAIDCLLDWLIKVSGLYNPEPFFRLQWLPLKQENTKVWGGEWCDVTQKGPGLTIPTPFLCFFQHPNIQ